MTNIPAKIRFFKEQRVFQQLTNKDALIDALISLYNNTTTKKCHQHKDTTNKFIQLYKPIYYELNRSKISLKDFQLLYKDTFVEGAFGKVTIVKSIQDNNIYALKTLNKSYLNNQIDRSSPMEERLILSNENEEWLPKLYASFQDKKKLYLVMEYAHGGDLENLMERRQYQFNENEAKFYCAQLILAVERVHQLGYMHRDIKPANILIDSKGHIKLGDLGSCISIDTKESLFMVGTMPYISPEMCNSEGSDSTKGPAYGLEVDWWSVGIILYELIYGVTPFTGKDIQIQMSLVNPNVSVQFDPKIKISNHAKDLLLRLLTKSKKNRLCDANELKLHPFFQDIDWNTLRTSAIPPFIPSIKSQDDITFFASTANQDNDDTSDEDDDDEDDDSDGELPFIGYTYSCKSLLDKSPTFNDKKSDNQAFLAQFRQKLIQPTSTTADSQHYIQEINKLKASIDEKNTEIDNIHSLKNAEIDTINSLKSAEIVELKSILDSQNQQIKQLESRYKSILDTSSNEFQSKNTNLDLINQELKSSHSILESNKKELESKNNTLESTITELHSTNKMLSSQIQELGSMNKLLKTSNTDLKSKNQQLVRDLTDNSKQLDALSQQLIEYQQITTSLKKEMEGYRNNKLLLEKENKQLSTEKSEFNSQLLELENHVLVLDDTLMAESKNQEALVKQLNEQSIDDNMLIRQSKAECMELKDALATQQPDKRVNQSLPNIPTSLIISTMWQRDRESLRHVQQVLEESENKLAFAKRQIIRLKKEVQCFQKYTFEQKECNIVSNTMDHHKKSYKKLPTTPPPHETIHHFDEFDPEVALLDNTKTAYKKNNNILVGDSPVTTTTLEMMQDLALLAEIEKEHNFINSTKRTIAARARLSRTKGEIDDELSRSIELANKKLSFLEAKLKQQINTKKSYSPKDFFTAASFV